MLGYYPPEKPPSENKRLKLLFENLDNIVELLKEELIPSENTNPVDVSKLIGEIQLDDTDYYDEDD